MVPTNLNYCIIYPVFCTNLWTRTIFLEKGWSLCTSLTALINCEKYKINFLPIQIKTIEVNKYIFLHRRPPSSDSTCTTSQPSVYSAQSTTTRTGAAFPNLQTRSEVSSTTTLSSFEAFSIFTRPDSIGTGSNGPWSFRRFRISCSGTSRCTGSSRRRREIRPSSWGSRRIRSVSWKSRAGWSTQNIGPNTWEIFEDNIVKKYLIVWFLPPDESVRFANNNLKNTHFSITW